MRVDDGDPGPRAAGAGGQAGGGPDGARSIAPNINNVPYPAGLAAGCLHWPIDRGRETTLLFRPASPLDQAAPEATFPTIVYFHANKANHHWAPGSYMDVQLAQVAHANGYHFISMDFRHPVADQYLAGYPVGTPVPHQDIKVALSVLRSNAPKMKIDVNRMYAFGIRAAPWRFGRLCNRGLRTC